MDLEVRPGWTIPADALRWRFSRSGGPGGQSVNTSDSRAELSVDLADGRAVPEPLRARVLTALEARLIDGVLTVVASEHRSQFANRNAALSRLGALLRAAAQPPAPQRRPTRPSRSARATRVEDKRQRGTIKRLRSRPAQD